jgi:hypothetical protein
MNRDQAITLEQCLADANGALDRARLVIAGFTKQDRMEFSDLLENVLDALHGGLLAGIYAQHPDMEPPASIDQAIPEMDSELRWDQVRLPSPVTEAEFDHAIRSMMSTRWRKTARIVGSVAEQYRSVGIDLDPAIVAARLKFLSDTDRIEGIGDLRMWRHSEVRLKD